jgi:hypothetical protein
VRRDGERLADIIEAAEKVSVRAGKGRQAFDAAVPGHRLVCGSLERATGIEPA